MDGCKTDEVEEDGKLLNGLCLKVKAFALKVWPDQTRGSDQSSTAFIGLLVNSGGVRGAWASTDILILIGSPQDPHLPLRHRRLVTGRSW